MRSQPSGLGDIVSGLVMVGLSGRITLVSAPLIVLASVAGAAVLLSTGVILHSATFWLGRTEAASRQLYEAILLFGLYPDTLFGGPLRIVLFTIIPAGFVGYLPAKLIREPSMPTALAILASVAIYCVAATWVFRRGLRSYSSGSRFLTFG